MFRLPSKPMLSAVGAACATGALALPAAIAAPAPHGPADVRVINTTANPIPVLPQGVSTVAGTVGIDPAANAVRVEQQGEYVEATSPMIVAPGENQVKDVLVEVPEGKRFIAEHATGELLLTDEGTLSRIRFGKVNGIEFGVEPTPGSGQRSYYSDDLHFEVRGPASVQASLFRVDGGATNSVANHTTLVGRMVDCPDCRAAE